MPIQGYPPPPPGVDSNGSAARGWGNGWPVCQSLQQRWIYLSNGVGLQLRREVSEMARLLLNETLRRGYQIRDDDSAGFVCRAITGTLIPSNHSWGLAVDINWRDNPMGTHTTDIPVWMVNLMWKYRWYWGGWYEHPDPMHFEYVGTPAQARIHTAAVKVLYGEGGIVAEKVELEDRAANALREIWALTVAMRDGAPTVDVPTSKSKEAWIVAQLKLIMADMGKINTKLDAITAKLDSLLTKP